MPNGLNLFQRVRRGELLKMIDQPFLGIVIMVVCIVVFVGLMFWIKYLIE